MKCVKIALSRFEIDFSRMRLHFFYDSAMYYFQTPFSSCSRFVFGQWFKCVENFLFRSKFRYFIFYIYSAVIASISFDPIYVSIQNMIFDGVHAAGPISYETRFIFRSFYKIWQTNGAPSTHKNNRVIFFRPNYTNRCRKSTFFPTITRFCSIPLPSFRTQHPNSRPNIDLSFPFRFRFFAKTSLQSFATSDIISR